MSDFPNKSSPHSIQLKAPLVCLSPSLVQQIDLALAKVGSFGEVRLVISKGRLRFIQIVQSESILENPAEEARPA